MHIVIDSYDFIFNYEAPTEFAFLIFAVLAVLAWLGVSRRRGNIHLLVKVYESEWEYRITVADTEWNMSEVAIELIGEDTDAHRLIDHEFALLDYILKDRAQIELMEMEE